jgi:hypothetical protein
MPTSPPPAGPTFAVPIAGEELTPGVIPGYVDPDRGPADVFDDQPAGIDGEATPLAQLLGELKTAVQRPELGPLEIPGRPGWGVTYRTDISDADLKRAQRAAKVKGKPRNADGSYDVDEVKLTQLLLGQYCTALWRGGEKLEMPDGSAITFRSPMLLQELSVGSVAEAVRTVYGTDGSVVSSGRALMAASGWLDDPDDVDSGPTLR